VHLDGAVVEENGPVPKLGLAEAGAGHGAVDDLAVLHQLGGHRVEIAVAPAPELQVRQPPAGGHHLGLARGDGHGRRGELAGRLAVDVLQRHPVGEGARPGAVVPHLAFGVDRGLAALDVELVGPDIDAGGAQAGIERQGLVQVAGQVQPHRPVDSAVVHIEVVVVPLEAAAGGALLVLPVIVDPHGDDVLERGGLEQLGGVDAEGRGAVLVAAGPHAVDVNVAGLAHALEVDDRPAAHGRTRACGQHEALAVPGDAGRVLVDVAREGLVLVEGAGQGDRLPGRVVER